MSFLQLINIGKSYDSNRVLNNINLEFSLNEFVCIVGPSGSGKTTLLNIIGLLEDNSEGKILINNHKINRNKYQFYKYNFFGYVYQNYEMVDYYTVKENIQIYDDKLKEEDILSLSSQFGCEELLDKYPSQLSGGEKQRISLIRALIKKPRILICDEPTGSLDSKNSETIMEYLKNNSENKLIIMATHDIALAKKYATRIIIVNSGQVSNDNYLIGINNSSDLIEEMHDYKTISSSVIKRNMRYFKTKNAFPLSIILLFSICLCLLSSIIGLSTGIKQYINDIKTERLDSNYFEMSYYKNNEITSNHDSIVKLLNNKGIEYNEINNYAYLLNNFFYKNIQKENDINFDFEISVINFSNKSEEEIIVNSLFYDKYQKEDLSITRDTQILEYNLNLDKTYHINKISHESKLYNLPRIYLSYSSLIDLFDSDFKEYIFMQDIIPIPNMFFISSDLEEVYKEMNDSEYFTSYLSAATKDYNQFIVYKSSSVIIYESFKDLTSSLSLCLIMVTIIILVLVLSIFNLVSKNITNKRKREFALMNSYGTSKSDLSFMIFIQNSFILMPSLLIGLSLYYLMHFISLSFSSSILGITYNILEFEIKGILASFYATILVCLLTSLSIISKQNLKSLTLELHNE